MEHIEIDKAKEAVLSIMLKEPIKETEDVISAYTLIGSIREQKSRLRSVGEIEKGLLDRLNDIYPKEIIRGKRKLFKKTPVTVKNYLDTISHGFTCDDIENNTLGNSYLSLKVRDGHYAITILKDFGREFIVGDDLETKINSNTKSTDIVVLKVGDNYTDGEFMKKLKNNGYSCK